MSTVPETRLPPTIPLVRRFGLRMLVEACLVHEEGVAALKDIEVGMMTGAGLLPGPLARADEQGLDEVLSQLETAASETDEHLAPPVTIRRLVALGRLGKKSGQGFFPYPNPDEGEQRETVLLETRGDVAIAWLNRPPSNALSPQLIDELSDLWKQVDGQVRSLVITSSSIFSFSAGADIKAFTSMEADDGERLVDTAHELMRSMEESRTATIACVNSAAFGGGCELAMACDFRIAARSALFGQPEVNLGIIPGFGGTQRLPRLVGEAMARRMMLLGDPIDAEDALRWGLVDDVVADIDLFDSALAWARRLAEKPPIAVEQIKRRLRPDDLDRGLAAEKQGFMEAFGSQDAVEGLTAFGEKRQPEFKGH